MQKSSCLKHSIEKFTLFLHIFDKSFPFYGGNGKLLSRLFEGGNIGQPQKKEPEKSGGILDFSGHIGDFHRFFAAAAALVFGIGRQVVVSLVFFLFSAPVVGGDETALCIDDDDQFAVFHFVDIAFGLMMEETFFQDIGQFFHGNTPFVHPFDAMLGKRSAEHFLKNPFIVGVFTLLI